MEEAGRAGRGERVSLWLRMDGGLVTGASCWGNWLGGDAQGCAVRSG